MSHILSQTETLTDQTDLTLPEARGSGAEACGFDARLRGDGQAMDQFDQHRRIDMSEPFAER